MTGLLLDTNVIISANLQDAGLEEYERVLRYPRLKFLPRQITAFLDRVRRQGIPGHPTKTATERPDESDNRFLECSEAAAADFLVTGNNRHFLEGWRGTESSMAES